MHRNSDHWTYGDDPLFSPVEQEVRKRIWYTCVIMDKYVSTYIGRPLSIFENDYDTPLPSVEAVSSCLGFHRALLMFRRGKRRNSGILTNQCRTPC